VTIHMREKGKEKWLQLHRKPKTGWPRAHQGDQGLQAGLAYAAEPRTEREARAVPTADGVFSTRDTAGSKVTVKDTRTSD
jgi:hypothetical protein